MHTDTLAIGKSFDIDSEKGARHDSVIVNLRVHGLIGQTLVSPVLSSRS